LYLSFQASPVLRLALKEAEKQRGPQNPMIRAAAAMIPNRIPIVIMAQGKISSSLGNTRQAARLIFGRDNPKRLTCMLQVCIFGAPLFLIFETLLPRSAHSTFE
jgi:hypothetical protein